MGRRDALTKGKQVLFFLCAKFIKPSADIVSYDPEWKLNSDFKVLQVPCSLRVQLPHSIMQVLGPDSGARRRGLQADRLQEEYIDFSRIT